MKKSLPTYQTNQINCIIYLILFLFIFPFQIIFSQARVVVNPGLEFGVPDSRVHMLDTNFGYNSTFDAGISSTSPWYTSHPSRPGGCTGSVIGNCHPIEVWGNGFLGVNAAQGRNFIELNAFVSSMIYQDLYLANGDIINYYYRHRARSNTSERAEMIIEDQNQVHIATIHTTRTPANTNSWSVNQGNYTFRGKDGIYRVGFRAIDNPGQNSAIGNLLDDIRITLNPFIDLKFSKSATSCRGENVGSLFLRINGAVLPNTKVAVELIDPDNGTLVASKDDITFTAVPNSNGTPSISSSAGNNIYLITIPRGNYDGGISPGYSNPTNDEDGIRFNIKSKNTNVKESKKTFKFRIIPQNRNGSTNNFDSTKYPDFNDKRHPTTDDYFLEECVCYNEANSTKEGLDSHVGISLLRQSKVDNDNNWPMIRKSASLVLESNTKGFVISRLTTSQINAITSPQEGMMIYDTDKKCLKIYNGINWLCFNNPTCP